MNIGIDDLVMSLGVDELIEIDSPEQTSLGVEVCHYLVRTNFQGNRG